WSQQSAEIWNAKAVAVFHEEEWTTLEHRTETYISGYDEKGNPEYSTRIVPYTQKHGPNWYATTELGENISIKPSVYHEWPARWHNDKKIGVNVGSSDWPDRAISGNIYRASWTGEFETIYPYSKVKLYENKIRT